MLIKWLLQQVFPRADPELSFDCPTREKLFDSLNSITESFDKCELVVKALIQYHETYKGSWKVCGHENVHNTLYVAVKLCHLWHLHTHTVCRLLTCIYACEGTFEKFFECSIFGTKVTQLISGWRGIHDTRIQNLYASVYFLDNAVKGQVKFMHCDRECNFVDIPMHCYENLPPLKVAVKAEIWDVVGLLIKYGAITYPTINVNNKYSYHFRAYSLFHLFVQKLEKYQESINDESNLPLIYCFKIFIRTVPILSNLWSLESKHEENALSWPALLIFLKKLGFENINEPRSLMHLSKCAIRQSLAQHQQLPACCEKLQCPVLLESYLNLEFD